MTPSRRSPCPICAEPTSPLDVAANSYVTGGAYALRSCQYCDLQYVDDRSVPENVYEAIYDNAAALPGYNRYAFYQAHVRNQADPLRWLSEQEPAYWFVRSELEAMPAQARVLEIGSGLGYLSYAIRESGRDVLGIDVSEKAVSRARALFGDIYARKDLFTLVDAPDRYDVVILTEVIEHVVAPIDFLKAAASLLKPGGRMLITTPNKSTAALDAVWKTENPPIHLWWFSETSIRQLARRAGLDVAFCDFTPMQTGRERTTMRSETVGSPAWLDASGHVTEAARTWVRKYDRRQRRTRLLRLIAPFLLRLEAGAKRKRRFGAAAAQRSTQIGAILRNRT